MDEKKITAGANDRPKHASISQTAPGIPDDSGGIPEKIDEAEVARVRAKLMGGDDEGEAEAHPS